MERERACSRREAGAGGHGARGEKIETPGGHSKYPWGVPGVLMSVPLPLPVGTLTRYPQGVSVPLSFPTSTCWRSAVAWAC